MSPPVQLAWEFGLTLVGFLRGNRFVLFSGEERLRLEEKAQLQRFLRQR